MLQYGICMGCTQQKLLLARLVSSMCILMALSRSLYVHVRVCVRVCMWSLFCSCMVLSGVRNCFNALLCVCFVHGGLTTVVYDVTYSTYVLSVVCVCVFLFVYDMMITLL